MLSTYRENIYIPFHALIYENLPHLHIACNVSDVEKKLLVGLITAWRRMNGTDEEGWEVPLKF
jgi:hypothetical protein